MDPRGGHAESPDSHPGALGTGRLRPGEQPRTPPLPHAHLSSASGRASAAAGPLGPIGGPLGIAGSSSTKLPLLQPHPSSRPHPHPHPHGRSHPQQGHSQPHSHSLSQQQQDGAIGNPLTRPLVRGTGPNPNQSPSPPYTYQVPHSRPSITSQLSASSSSSFSSHNTLTPIAATPVTSSQHQYHQPLPQHHQPQHQNHHPPQHHHQQPQRDGSSGPVTPEDDVANGDPNDPKKHRACESCRGLKVRCEPNPDGEPDPDGPNPDGPCKRCAKAGRTCVVIQPTRKRQKKTDNRVAELEKKIDALTATLQATQATRTTMVLQPAPSSRPGSSDLPETLSPMIASTRDADSVAGSSTTGASGAGRDWGRERSSSTAQRSPSTKNMSSYGTIDINVGGYSPPAMGGMKRKHGVSGPPGPPRPETPEEGPDIVDRGLVTMEQAEMLFKRYTDQMAPHLPAVVFPADMTAADLRVEKPILFHSVMAVAAAVIPSIQRALTKELMQVFAESIVIIGRKSLELVQALHVAVIWYWPPEAFEELKFYQLVHISAVMAIDIGLGRKSAANGGFRKHMPTGDHPLKKNVPPDPTTIEARRTWLACYFLATNTAMALHRPNLIRWTPFMADCVEVLQSSDEAAPTDKYLTHLIWTHKLAEEVSVLLSMDDTSSTPNLADARTQYALKGFERDLESYRESISEELRRRRVPISVLICTRKLIIFSVPLDELQRPEPLHARNRDAHRICRGDEQAAL